MSAIVSPRYANKVRSSHMTQALLTRDAGPRSTFWFWYFC